MLAQLAALLLCVGFICDKYLFLSVCDLPLKMCVEDEKEEEVKKKNAVTNRKRKMAVRD